MPRRRPSSMRPTRACSAAVASMARSIERPDRGSWPSAGSSEDARRAAPRSPAPGTWLLGTSSTPSGRSGTAAARASPSCSHRVTRPRSAWPPRKTAARWPSRRSLRGSTAIRSARPRGSRSALPRQPWRPTERSRRPASGSSVTRRMRHSGQPSTDPDHPHRQKHPAVYALSPRSRPSSAATCPRPPRPERPWPPGASGRSSRRRRGSRRSTPSRTRRTGSRRGSCASRRACRR